MYFDILLDENQFLGGAIMFRRDAFLHAGGWRADLRAIEDYELMLRVARQGPIAVHREAVLEYREHEGSYTRRYTQLDYADEVARTAARMAGPRGHAAGVRTRIFLMKFSLDEVFWQMRGDLRAGRVRDLGVRLRRALNPLLLPRPSLAAARCWFALAWRNLTRTPKKRDAAGNVIA
jgi:GT2 family glycosyltransferase